MRLSAGSASGMPSITLARPFSARLRSSHRAATRRAVVATRVAEDVRVARDELRGDGVGDAAQVEEPLLGAEVRVEHDLEQQVAQLLVAQCSRGTVEGRRTVGALARRRAPRRAPRSRRAPRRTPRAGSERASACVWTWSHGHRARSAAMRSTRSSVASPAVRSSGRYTEVRWSRLGEAAEVREREVHDALVVEPEVVQHDRARSGSSARSASTRSGDVGEHLGGVRLGEQQRAGTAEPVGQRRARRRAAGPTSTGSMPQRRAGEVDEAQRRDDDEVDVVARREQRDGALRDASASPGPRRRRCRRGRPRRARRARRRSPRRACRSPSARS